MLKNMNIFTCFLGPILNKSDQKTLPNFIRLICYNSRPKKHLQKKKNDSKN